MPRSRHRRTLDDGRLAGLAPTLVVAAVALAAAPDSPAGRLLFALAAVLGWLLSFLMGVLQRILPFLASMHAAQGQRWPPTPSALTLTRALHWHAVARAGAGLAWSPAWRPRRPCCCASPARWAAWVRFASPPSSPCC